VSRRSVAACAHTLTPQCRTKAASRFLAAMPARRRMQVSTARTSPVSHDRHSRESWRHRMSAAVTGPGHRPAFSRLRGPPRTTRTSSPPTARSCASYHREPSTPDRRLARRRFPKGRPRSDTPPDASVARPVSWGRSSPVQGRLAVPSGCQPHETTATLGWALRRSSRPPPTTTNDRRWRCALRRGSPR